MPNISPFTHGTEVSMRKKKLSRAALIELYTAEALRLCGGVSQGQRRMLRVAAAVGRELEPCGPLAGKIS